MELLTFVYAINDKVLLYTTGDGKSLLRIYDSASMEEISSRELDYTVSRIIPINDGTLLAAIHKRVENRRYSAIAAINPDTLELVKEYEVPGHCRLYCYNKKDGYIYLRNASKLYRVRY